MAGFLTELDAHLDGDCTWVLDAPLVYQSGMLYWPVIVSSGFCTDLASVPRIPIIFESWGGRCHRESVLHDYLYRDGADPDVSYSMANLIFLEAMKSRGVSFWIRWPMYWAVCAFGWTGWKKGEI